MSKPTQIYIDDSGRVHVSYQCDSCSEWTHVEDHCGYGDTSRFGPGTSAHTLHMDDMDGLHADVNTVYCLVDSGLIDATKAPNIFKAGE
jgi:hypothetical protein